MNIRSSSYQLLRSQTTTTSASYHICPLLKRSISSHQSFSTTITAIENENHDHQSPQVYGVTYVPTLKITRHHTKGGDYGLYDGLKIRAGDNVSKSKHRTKRIWKPNLQKSKFWSEVLGQSLQLRATTAAIKTIDRMGGLDRYVLTASDERLGGTGIRIRDLVISAMKEKVKLTKAFTQSIPKDEQWRIPQWQDSSERADRSIIRKMVASLDVKQVTVFPRTLDPNQPAASDSPILQDFRVRGKKGSQTSRRSTHPRR